MFRRIYLLHFSHHRHTLYKVHKNWWSRSSISNHYELAGAFWKTKIVWIDTSYKTHKRTDQHFKYTDADLSCIYITTELISVTTCIKWTT